MAGTEEVAEDSTPNASDAALIERSKEYGTPEEASSRAAEPAHSVVSAIGGYAPTSPSMLAEPFPSPIETQSESADALIATTAPLAGVVLADHIAPDRGPTGPQEDAPAGVPVGYVDPQFRSKSVAAIAYDRFRARMPEGAFPPWDDLNEQERQALTAASDAVEESYVALTEFQRHVTGVICWR